MKTKILFMVLCFVAISIKAQKIKSYEINAEFFPDDAKFYGNEVSPDNFMRGNSIVEFTENQNREVTFYLHGEFKIDSILRNGEKIKYNSQKVFYDYCNTNIALKVTTDNLVLCNKLHVFYSGFYNHSQVSSISNYMRINKHEGVFLRAYGYSLWFPIFIGPQEDSYETEFNKVTVKLPARFKALVKGELVSESVKHDIYTAVWKPGLTDLYDLQCSAAEYEVLTKNNIFVYHKKNDNSKSSAKEILDFAIKLKALYSKNLIQIDNSLPLYINEMPQYGDISSANVIGIQESGFNNFEKELYSQSTMAHELIHQYVQLPVSIDNEFFALVIEGFPSFFQKWAMDRVVSHDIYSLNNVMKNTENRYLHYRKTGMTYRGNQLPIEKAVLDIKANEIGKYKDKFVLSDRVHLFIYDLWMKIGDEKFDDFLDELFSFKSIDYQKFESLILEYLPGYKENLSIWLRTTDYPESFKLK